MSETYPEGHCPSFVIYRLPGHTEPILLTHEAAGQGTYTFCLAPFRETKDCPHLVFEANQLQRGAEALQSLSTLMKENGPQEAPLPEGTEASSTYTACFARFHEALQSGRFQKLVLSRPFPAQWTDAAGTFERLCGRYPHSLVYLLHIPESGTWLGATPELLLRHTPAGWDTMALAGTKTDSEAPWDAKNREEQALVRRYLREQLRPHCQRVTEGETHTLHTGQLHHLCTRLQFEPWTGVEPKTLAQALHPTPAVCGLPKREAISFITQHEGYPRTYYAGYLGPIGVDGETHLYANIRCARLHADGRATAYAGSGLLASSTLESEREEIRQKSQALFHEDHV